MIDGSDIRRIDPAAVRHLCLHADPHENAKQSMSRGIECPFPRTPCSRDECAMLGGR